MDKITIIHDDGTFDNVGAINDGELHSQTLLKYAKEKHPENIAFEKLNYRHTPELISYFFLDGYNDVLFFNTTKNIQKHGYTGILMLPELLNEKQKIHIIRLLESAKDYDLSIMYDLSLSEGLLDGKEVLSNKRNNHISDLDAYFKEKKHSTRIKKS